MKHLLLICCITFAFTTISSAYAETLISPPLPVINNQTLEIRMHRDWLITHQDNLYAWHTSSYDFEVRRPYAGRSQNAKFDVEVIVHSLVRAQMHGDLVGRKYRIPSGLEGLIHTESFAPNEQDWYLTIPIKKTQGALIIRLVNLKGSSFDQKNTAYSIFRGIYFSSRRSRK